MKQEEIIGVIIFAVIGVFLLYLLFSFVGYVAAHPLASTFVALIIFLGLGAIFYQKK
jgi:lipopolysaccharide export LptBFGC system permease protein LptF